MAPSAGAVRTVSISRPLRLRGTISPPGDKSISHRAVMLNSVANGVARITNYSTGADCASTVEVLRGLGVQVDASPDPSGGPDILTVHGVGMDGFEEPSDVLDAGNSGTTVRLMSGLLAGRTFQSVLTGDPSLRSRPMARVVEPLAQMGAHIHARDHDRFAPIVFAGRAMHGIDHELPVASAQIKSCLLFAGLRASGETVARSPALSRDHSERMLSAMGAPVTLDGATVSISASELAATDVEVPADISSAAFWLVAAVVHPDADIRLENVGLNPSRTGVLTVLHEMGANIRVENEREVAGEPVGDLVARSSALRGVDIGGAIIPLLIDEIPVLAVAAAVAEGETRIRDAGELRVKETDRIAASVEWLHAAGVDAEELPDGMTIRGRGVVRGATCDSYGDHRMAMAMAVASLVAKSPITIEGAAAADVSYPDFWRDLETIAGTAG